MRRSGFRVRDSELGKLVGLGVLVVCSTAAFAAQPRDENPGTGLRITVMVYNYAKVPEETLSQAGKVAAGVFKAVGVEIEWVECPTTSAEPVQNPACRESSPAKLRLRILPDLAPQAWDSLGKDVMGFAVAAPGPDYGYLASVYYDRVRGRAEELRHYDWQLLGFAIAHEIGHLLLGSNSHSHSGLMRANWDKDAMAWAVRGMLALSQEERSAICADVQARNESDSAARIAAAAPQ